MELPRGLELTHSPTRVLNSGLFFPKLATPFTRKANPDRSRSRPKQSSSKDRSIEKRSTAVTGTQGSKEASRNTFGSAKKSVELSGSATKKERNPWSESKRGKKDTLTQSNWQEKESQVTGSESEFLEGSYRFNTINDPKFFKEASKFDIPKEED
jgi:hypothetical protein